MRALLRLVLDGLIVVPMAFCALLIQRVPYLKEKIRKPRGSFSMPSRPCHYLE